MEKSDFERSQRMTEVTAKAQVAIEDGRLLADRFLFVNMYISFHSTETTPAFIMIPKISRQ